MSYLTLDEDEVKLLLEAIGLQHETLKSFVDFDTDLNEKLRALELMSEKLLAWLNWGTS